MTGLIAILLGIVLAQLVDLYSPMCCTPVTSIVFDDPETVTVWERKIVDAIQNQ